MTSRQPAPTMRPSLLPHSGWPLARCLVVALCAVVAFLLSSTLPTIVFPPQPGSSTAPTVTFEKSLLIIGPVLLLLAFARPLSARIMGVGFGVAWRTVLWGIGGAVLLGVIVNMYQASRGGSDTPKDLADMGLGVATGKDIALVLAITLIAPVGEEIIFRGMFHRAIRDGLRRWVHPLVAMGVAIVSSSLYFASIHDVGGQSSMMPMFVLFGVLTALAYEFTGSLYAPVILHCANNGYVMGKGLMGMTGPGNTSPLVVGLAFAAPVLGVGLVWACGRVFNLPKGKEAARETQ